MKDLKAVFWDVDGTIADTEMFGHRIAFNKAFDDYGLNWHWDQDLYRSLLKISGGINRIKYYSDKNEYDIDDSQIIAIQKSKQDYYRHIVENETPRVRPGVYRLINELGSLEIIQIIVTTSSSKSLQPLLSNLFPSNIELFTDFITYEDVSNHKPDSEAYELAIKRSGVALDSIIAIEDSIIGLQSVKSANIKCLLTLSPWIVDPPNGSELADTIVNDLGEPKKYCKVHYGLTPSNGYVDYQFLNSIINS